MKGLRERLIDERTIIFVIALNTAAMFIRGFPGIGERASSWLFAVDYFCTVYFVLELFLKVRHWGWPGFISAGWNRFDLTIVVLSLPMLLSPIVPLEDFSIVLVLRMGRILRSFRLLRFVPDADRLWSGIQRALRASVGVLAALAVYNLALGLCGRYLLGDVAPAHFGDPIIAAYSIFKVFTIEGWYEIPDAIAATSGAPMATFARLFFVFSVSTGGILGLSMANAVFVDEMVMDNTDELEAEIKKLQFEVVELRDENQRAFAELKALLTSHGGAGSADNERPG